MRKLKLEELNRLSLEEFRQSEKNRIILVLNNIRSMHNVGSMFRTADAFAVEKICICGITQQPPHREIRKTAIGAEESVEWEYHADVVALLKRLKDEGRKVIALEQTDSSVSLADFQPEAGTDYVVVVGNEVEGVDEAALEICDTAVEIRQWGTKHSLNVAVAAGILLWAMVK